MLKKRAIMRKTCLTTVCLGSLVLLVSLFWFPGEALHAAQTSEGYKSEPIKIERPEKAKPEKAQPEAEEAKKEEPAEASAPAVEKPGSETPEETPKPQTSDEAKAKSEEQAEAAEAEKEAKQAQGDEEAKPSAVEDSQEDALGLIDEGEDLYSRKGRVDPFAPFVQGPEPDESSKAKEKLQQREPRTPLERISLGQLRLTAVMEMPDQNLAMVEEASGKGYVVKQGTYIGDQGGRITEIMSEAIIVEEKYLDVFGKVSVRKKQLKLQK